MSIFVACCGSVCVCVRVLCRVVHVQCGCGTLCADTSRPPNNLKSPHSKTSTPTYFPATISLWNSLPPSLQSLSLFNSTLKDLTSSTTRHFHVIAPSFLSPILSPPDLCMTSLSCILCSPVSPPGLLEPVLSTI